MLVVVSPTLRRLLVELAAGPRRLPARRRVRVACIFPPPPNTTADRAGDLLAATSALAYLRDRPGRPAAPEAAAADRPDPRAWSPS